MAEEKINIMNITKGLHFDEGYINWQLNRVLFLINLMGRDFFQGKKMLELGSYQGGITQMFHNLGANITGVEGSKKNLGFAKNKYPHLTFIEGDCDDTTWRYDEKYDIIIHWGLLYHLKTPKESILNCIAHCDILCLETLVVDSNLQTCELVDEDNINLSDQALNGKGSRFSASYIEQILTDAGTRWTRYDNESLDSKYHPPYSAIEKNTGATYRRFWVVHTCKYQSRRNV